MALGRKPAQIGVTEAMIETFGETIFRLSHNFQRRIGDPVRTKDLDEIERQRASLGLSDGEIAKRIGLTRAQVIHIRNVMEWRRYRPENYGHLAALGGGRRFRLERQVRPEDERSQSTSAHALRQAMSTTAEAAGRYIDAGWWCDHTLRTWLAGHVEARPDKAALVHAGGTITFAELGQKVGALAGALYRLGVRKGDVVAVQLPNLPEYVICYLAITHIGAVLTTLYMPHRAQEMETLLRHASARVLICLDDAGDFQPAATALRLKDNLSDLLHVVTLGDGGAGALTLGELLENDGLPGGEPPVGADPCLLLYTSGTTASPKGVPHSGHTVLSNAWLSAPEHGIDAADILLSAAPFGHLFGLYSIHLALAVGATQYLLPNFTPPDLAEALRTGGATVLFGAPAHIAACLKAGLFAEGDLAALKLAILSGAAVPDTLARDFDALLANGAVSQLWGMTETQAGLYTRPGDGIDIAAGGAGRPSPGTEVRIADDAGADLGGHEEGELQIRGPLLFPGYFLNEEANRDAFTDDGWFRTGDLARRDDKGNIAIIGRTKDVINRGGVKFNPRDVEDSIDSHPKIAQSAIVPMPDEILGERACVFVVLSGAEAVSLDEIRNHLAEAGIAKPRWPERLEIVTEMPLTPTRKVIKGRLRPGNA